MRLRFIKPMLAGGDQKKVATGAKREREESGREGGKNDRDSSSETTRLFSLSLSLSLWFSMHGGDSSDRIIRPLPFSGIAVARVKYTGFLSEHRVSEELSRKRAIHRTSLCWKCNDDSYTEREIRLVGAKRGENAIGTEILVRNLRWARIWRGGRNLNETKFSYIVHDYMYTYSINTHLLVVFHHCDCSICCGYLRIIIMLHARSRIFQRCNNKYRNIAFPHNVIAHKWLIFKRSIYINDRRKVYYVRIIINHLSR